MICTNCGKNLPENAKFCGACGSQMGMAAQPAQSQNAQPQRIVEPQMQQQFRPTPPPPQQPPQQQMYRGNINNSGSAQAYSPSIMSVGSYLVTFLIVCIPIVGFIMLLVWSFGSSTNQNKKNFARALLVIMVITAVLYFVLGGMIMAMFMPTGF